MGAGCSRKGAKETKEGVYAAGEAAQLVEEKDDGLEDGEDVPDFTTVGDAALGQAHARAPRAWTLRPFQGRRRPR